MIIKRLEIHSFGKLKDRELVFTDKLNVIYGRNESGKSTLSSFIEAMFYSYPSRDADRKKYIPWDESVSQGSMTINSNGEDITIYRKLTASPSKDVFEISKDIILTDIIPRDRETYRKSVYCAEGKATDFGRCAQIDMRIANILSSGDENINAGKAISLLEGFRKSIKPRKGSGGKLKEIEDKITELENSLEAVKKNEIISKQQSEKISERECKLKELSESRDKLIAASDNFDYSPLRELEGEIEAQRKYISEFPQTEEAIIKPFSFPKTLTLVYILCTILSLIIGFLVNPFLYFIALIPLLSFFVHFLCKKRQYNTKKRLFLSSVGCSNKDEYNKMLCDKKDAEDYYSQLLKKHESLQMQLRSEDLNARDEINRLDSRMLEVRESILSLQSTPILPSEHSKEEIMFSLNEYNRERDELKKKIEALDKAIEAINYARDNLSKTLAPSVAESAMMYINKIAPKKGRKINLSKDLTLSLTDPMPQEISSCSFGLREEIHLCFRIALSEYLYGKDFPLIFDDPFSGSDDYREKALIDLFLSLSEDRQIIIFTNRKNSYYNQIPCNFIDISPSFDV